MEVYHRWAFTSNYRTFLLLVSCVGSSIDSLDWIVLDLNYISALEMKCKNAIHHQMIFFQTFRNA